MTKVTEALPETPVSDALIRELVVALEYMSLGACLELHWYKELHNQ